MAGVAYVFHFAPSEIDALEVDELLRWSREASRIVAPPPPMTKR